MQAIHKDLVDPDEWEIVLPNYNLKGNPRLEDECREVEFSGQFFSFFISLERTNKINSIMMQEISSPDCWKVYFERDPNGCHDSTSNWSKVKIDLFNPIMLKSSADDSGYDVLLDLLNIIQIMFDFQFLKLLSGTVLFFRVKVFELYFVTRKLFLYPVYAFCLVGFVFHVDFIFDQVRNSRLVFSNYYEEVASQPMPELNFCLQHQAWPALEKELNSTKAQITGDHLERATSYMRADTVFRFA